MKYSWGNIVPALLVFSTTVFTIHTNAEIITLIQVENGYNGFQTDNYGNEPHNQKFGPNTTKHPWVWDDPWTGSNTTRADVADYCC